MKSKMNRKLLVSMLSLSLALGVAAPALIQATANTKKNNTKKNVQESVAQFDQSSQTGQINQTLQSSQTVQNSKVELSDQAARTSQEEQSINLEQSNPSDYASDRVIVKYKNGANRNKTSALSSAETYMQLPSIGAEVLQVPEETDIKKLVETLNNDPNVLYAEPDYKVSRTEQPNSRSITQNANLANTDSAQAAQLASLTSKTNESNDPAFPNDPMFEQQWALHNTGQLIKDIYDPSYDSEGVAGIDIGAIDAWKYTTGQDVLVAVLDDGVQINHPDLQQNIWVNPNEQANGEDDDGNGFIDDVNGWNFVDNNNQLFARKDWVQYNAGNAGTFVAGVIGAITNNGIGVAGVAPDVKILPIKVLDSIHSGNYTEVIQGIEYAASKGAKIACFTAAGFTYSRALKEAIEASGMLFVTEAGSDGRDIDKQPVYPASFDSPNIITVTSVDNKGELAPFINYGIKSVDLAAPGSNVYGLTPTDRLGFGAQIDNGTYKAVFNGFGMENLSVEEQRLDVFKKEMEYLAPLSSTPKVLLVQDDEHDRIRRGSEFPDFLDVYKQLLQSSGYEYDVKTVKYEKEGPALDELQQYDAVVWFTGNAFGVGYSEDDPDRPLDPNKTTLTTTDQANLTTYLNGGGRLLLTGQDAIFHIENSSFVTDILHLDFTGESMPSFVSGARGTAYAGKYYSLENARNTKTFLLNDDSVANLIFEGSYAEHIPNDYINMSSSGVATAHVAGAAALLWSAKPNLDIKAVKDRLIDTGLPLDSLRGKVASRRMLNVYQALIDNEIPGVAIHEKSVSDQLNAVDSPVRVYGVNLYAGETLDLSLTGDAGTDFDLYLYSPSAKTVTSTEGLLASSEQRGTSDERISYKITQSGTYYIEVVAYAGAGSYTLNLNYDNEAGIYQDNDSTLFFSGSWSTLEDGIYSGGTAKQIDEQGSVELAFLGNNFKWVGSKGPDQGYAKVYVDDVYTANLSLYNSKVENQQTLYETELSSGRHSIRIEWTGRKDIRASAKAHAYINVDYFVVSNIFPSYDSAIRWAGGWADNYNTQHYSNDALYSRGEGDYAELSFEGAQITLYAYTSSKSGEAEIYIDNQLVNTVDFYSSQTKYRVPVFTSEILPKGKHTIKVVNAGTKNENSSGTSISIDTLTVE